MKKCDLKHAVLSVWMIVSVFLLHSVAIAADKVVVVPLGKSSSGDAMAADVLEGKTFSNKDEVGIPGTMPTQSLDPSSSTVPAGYYEATTLDTVDSELVPANIPVGITIFGVQGTLSAPYLDRGNGTITVNATNLMWQKTDDGMTYTWLEAGAYCAMLNLGGHPIGSWRLPTKDELKGLVVCTNGHPVPLEDYYACYDDGYSGDFASPTIDSSFSCQIDDYYWTSSEYDTDKAWCVGFSDGYNEWCTRIHDYYVRCVR